MDAPLTPCEMSSDRSTGPIGPSMDRRRRVGARVVVGEPPVANRRTPASVQAGRRHATAAVSAMIRRLDLLGIC
jgi:hypothetical protein